MPPRSQKQPPEEVNTKLEKLSISDNSKNDNKKKKKKKIDTMNNSDSNHDQDETTNDRRHLIKEVGIYLPAGNACTSDGVGFLLKGSGINPWTFCNDFNQHTANLKLGSIQPVSIKIYDDHTYTYCIKERGGQYYDEKYHKDVMRRGALIPWRRFGNSWLL